MKRVLVITYFFPPSGAVQVQRMLPYIRYLQEYGWKPYVLTARASQGSDLSDPSLLNLLPKGLQITHTDFFDLASISRFSTHRWFRHLTDYWSRFIAVLPPDPLLGWFPFAVAAGRRILRAGNIDAICTLSTPVSAHLIGYYLQHLTGKPWVADLSDDWTPNTFRVPLYGWQKRLDAWLEQKVFRAADAIVASSPTFRDQIVAGLPREMASKVEVITNGYDGLDFEDAPLRVARRDRLKIAYVGDFYGERRPTQFLVALNGLLEQGEIPIDRITVLHVGRPKPGYFVDFSQSKVASIVEHVGFVSHSEAIEYVKQADVLLLLLSPGGQGRLPVKLFEYMASGRPILALVPPNGETAQLIRKTRTGVIADIEDISESIEAIRAMYSAWKDDSLHVDTDWDMVRQFETHNMAVKMAGVLGKIA